MLTGMMTNFGASGMVQKLQECRVTITTSCTLTVMAISIVNKSTGFSFRIQWESTFQSKFAQFSSWISFRDASCSIYKMTTIFLLYVFQILCILSNKAEKSACFCTYRLPHYLYNGWKTLAWIVRLLFWVGEKQSTSMSVVNANLWWCCGAVDAEPWNNRVW